MAGSNKVLKTFGRPGAVQNSLVEKINAI